MQFTPLGIPVRDAGLFRYAVGPDATGRLNTVYLSFFQTQAPWFVVGVNVETGESRHYQGAKEEGCWAITLGPDQCMYTGTCTKEARVNRIDPHTGQVTDLGQAIPGETYIWSMTTAADGCIYGGTYPCAKLFKYDPTTGVMEDLGRMDPTEQYNRTVKASGDYVYSAIGTVHPKVAAYHIRTGDHYTINLPDLDMSGTPSLMSGADGYIYCILAADRFHGGKVYRYRLEGLDAIPVEDTPPEERPRLVDGRRLKSANAHTITLVADDGSETHIPYTYEGAGALVYVLRSGPDGNLYGSSALPLRVFQVQPESGRMRNLGNLTQTGGEIYSFLAHKGRLFACAYPRACLTVFDPGTLPQTAEDNTAETHRDALVEPNPRHLGFVGEGQDRAPAMIEGPDGLIYIGTIPNYGMLGGALVRLHPDEYTWEAHRNVIPDQSVVSLAADPVRNRIYAGTTIGGGGGSHPTATCACIFAWDCGTQAKVGEWYPVPDVGGISSLAIMGRRLFGFTSIGQLFVFDLDEERVIYRSEPTLGRPHSCALVPHGDKRLLALLGDHIAGIDADTWEIQDLGSYPGISAGFAIHGDSVYFAANATVIRGVLPPEWQLPQ